MIDSYVGATNFCTGSQSDYSTCITNNMKFTAVLDDEYKSANFVGVPLKNSVCSIVSGTSYVDLKSLAIANIFNRIKMTNDFGVVSFRCSEVFNRPRLPLPRLQDLGLQPIEIVDIIGIDPTSPVDPEDQTEFEGIPLSTEDNNNGYLFNIVNLLIGYTTNYAETQKILRNIKSIIVNMYNYYDLPGLGDDALEQINKTISIHIRLTLELNKFTGNNYYRDQLLELHGFDASNLLAAKNIIQQIRDELSVINPSTDFTTFDFTITDGVVDKINNIESNISPFLNYSLLLERLYSQLYGIPPVFPKDIDDDFLYQCSSELRRITAESLKYLTSAYSSPGNVLTTLHNLNVEYSTYFKNDKTINWLNNANVTDTELLTKTIDLINFFTFEYSNGNIVDVIDSIYDADDLQTSMSLIAIELDLYFQEIGNTSSIKLYELSDLQKVSTSITEVNLGASFKDAGNFYYADIAYAVGYTKLANIYSIQIDDEYYEINEDTSGISESGCTRYKFTRHVLPTYQVEVEMYVYPGTPDQPYCPTVNSYHNFATSKYSGMFTKLDNDGLMGVYLFKGYRPMKATVEEVIQLGKMDLNSINLNDPSLDKNAYETMLMKDIKSLTNSSSINNNPISTDDFKYYFASVLDSPEYAFNNPGLAIIEFKRFPLGNSAKFPKIRILTKGEDFVL